jgi:hypothetical protein
MIKILSQSAHFTIVAVATLNESNQGQPQMMNNFSNLLLAHHARKR